MANVMLEISTVSLQFMSPDVPEVRVFASDFKFWITVNEY